MSTGDSTVRLMRFDALMIIGEYTPSTPLEVKFRGCLGSPRVIGMQQTAQGQRIVFMELIGKPQSIPVPDGALIYTPTEEDLVAAYKENVTGLVIARPLPLNVVPMGGRA